MFSEPVWFARTSLGVILTCGSAEAALEPDGDPKNRKRASMVSCGCSSISQCPAFDNVIDSALTATSFTCLPKASPLAFSAADRKNRHRQLRLGELREVLRRLLK
jgi:hypothetical protein